ncbi:MAG: hypothetical protein IJG80_04620 [Selenomonadaceae bacterium]|nr:hypothetical protein [Selenomonadaceae bacterium]MBQ3725689.1 hypothetical protein [Selenomonadaceae bacterium]MBQ9496863.1 hypothetical protein [Selenomonadaceae bacterium]
MTEQEKINAEVQKQLAMQDAKFNTFMQEMRDRDKQRADDIRELRQDMKSLQISLDAKIDSMGKHVRNLSVATIIGVSTIAITVIYSILSR